MENSVTQSDKPSRRSAVIKWAVVLGIAIVANLFLIYLVQVLYASPQYAAFCPDEQVRKAIQNQDECVSVGGQWTPPRAGDDFADVGGQPLTKPVGLCDTTYTCSKQFNAAESVYNRNVFLIFIIAGVILVLEGVFLRAGAATIGLSLGGLLAFIIGSVRYWSDMNDLLRVAILGAALLALLWVAAKKFRD